VVPYANGIQFFSIQHTYAKAGVFTVGVTVTDSGGLSSGLQTISESVSSTPILTEFDTTVHDQNALTVRGTVAGSPGEAGTVRLDWGDGQSVDATYSADDGTFGASHFYDRPLPIPYNVTAHPFDNELSGAASQVPVLITNVAPVVQSVTIPGVTAGTPATLTGTTFDPGLADSCTALVDWGDGSTGTLSCAGPTVCACAGTFSGTHTYAQTGTYSVDVKAVDNNGGVSPDLTASVTVSAVPVVVTPPVVTPTPPAAGGGATSGTTKPVVATATLPLLTKKSTLAVVEKALRAKHFLVGDLNLPHGYPKAPRGFHYVVFQYYTETILHVKVHGKLKTEKVFTLVKPGAKIAVGRMIALKLKLVRN
jgi:hypothetical protein